MARAKRRLSKNVATAINTVVTRGGQASQRQRVRIVQRDGETVVHEVVVDDGPTSSETPRPDDSGGGPPSSQT